MFSMNLLL